MQTYRNLLVVLCSTLFYGCSDLNKSTTKIPFGGRAVAVTVHPTDASLMIVASETGGLFKTTNTGSNWTQISKNATFGFTDVLIYPLDPNVIIATAGSDYKTATGGGVWRSVDGGNTWTHMTLTPPVSSCATNLTGYALSFQSAAHRVFAGTSCGLAFSDDAGATWSFMPSVTGYNNEEVVAVASPAANTVIICTRYQIRVTTNGGSSWSTSSTGLPSSPSSGIHYSLAVSPSNPGHIYWAHNFWDGGWKNGLSFSKDTGASWSLLVNQGGINRPPMVCITKSFVDGGATKYMLYHSDGGCQLHRASVTHSSSPTMSAWTDLANEHCDYSQIAFAGDGITPQLLIGDGGLQKTTDGGLHWTMAGAGEGSYDALQITEVTGQQHAALDGTADLYFATQDNNIFASPDNGATWPNSICCEGFFLGIPREPVSASDTKLTGVTCGACYNFVSNPLLASAGGFPNPPNDAGNPFFLTPGNYIQNTKLPGLTGNVFMHTANNGSTWNNRYGFNEEVQDISRKGGSSSNPVVFTAARFPGATPDGDAIIRMKKIVDVVGAGTPVVSNVGGFGSIGIFATMFAWYKPYGVSPFNANFIMVADITDNWVKKTTDGGATWKRDSALTTLITQNGNMNFRLGAFSQLTSFGFDPDCPNHILVGTAQAGVMQSYDGSATWAYVPDSDLIPYVSSFFFPGKQKAVISSYGRGLWTLSFKECPSLRLPKDKLVLAVPLIRWKGAYVPITDIDDPDVCPICGFILVRGGEIINVIRNAKTGTIEKVVLSGGQLEKIVVGANKTRSLEKQEEQFPFEVAYAKEGRFDGDKDVDSLLDQTVKVKGIYVEGNLYKGAILAKEDIKAEQLPQQEAPVPSIKLVDIPKGYISINELRVLRIAVQGFDTQKPFELLIDGKRIDNTSYKMEKNEQGIELLIVNVPLQIGSHKVLLRQKGEQLRQDVAIFNVSHEESEDADKGKTKRK